MSVLGFYLLPTLLTTARTWGGTRGEQWSSAQGLESILWSIQSLMSQNPYENEPGYSRRAGPKDVENQEAYRLKVSLQ